MIIDNLSWDSIKGHIYYKILLKYPRLLYKYMKNTKINELYMITSFPKYKIREMNSNNIFSCFKEIINPKWNPFNVPYENDHYIKLLKMCYVWIYIWMHDI